MTRLSLPLAALALVLANPALAEDRPPESEWAERLNDPAFQDGMVGMFTGFMAAMMELPVGQIAHSVENAIPDDMRPEDDRSRIDPDTTLGDMARRDNPDFDQDMEDKVRQGTAMMGIMASEFSTFIPELRDMAERMKRRMEQID